MPQSFDVTLHLNECVSFALDPAVPENLQGKNYRVTRISALILNDFYFNNEVFTCYELQDEQGNILFATPFRFEEDIEDKLRISKPLSQQEIQTLFPKHDPKTLFIKTMDPNEAKTISFDDQSVPSELKNWLGHSYFIDLKDHDVATASYIEYDSKNKKNINAEMLLAKHPSTRYTLFQGDYAIYFLEANFDTPYSLLATLFLEATHLERKPTT